MPHLLKIAYLETPLGLMQAVADKERLYHLDFIERSSGCLEGETGHTPPIASIEKELKLYFEGKLKQFTTALCLAGTPFQQKVWQALLEIPYGKTISYAQLATHIGNAKAFRAVAQANGANQFAILIPCHRVINANGALGGYGGGLERKEWLLHHEKGHL